MEIRHLRYFVIVAEEENVTRAAARLHVSQPPLSRQIRDLEDELGVSLFDRTGKSLQLNAAGKVFLGEARAVLERAEQAKQTVRALSNEHREVIQVGYAPTLTVEILPEILRLFEDAQPNVRLELHDLSSEEMRQGLDDGSLDAAFVAMPQRLGGRGYPFISLQNHSICVAMPSKHPLAKKRKIALKEVLSHRLIGYSKEGYREYHEWLAQLLLGVTRNVVLSEECDSMTSLITAIETGRGVALVTKSLSYFSGSRLQFRPITPDPDPLEVGLVWRSKTLSQSTRALIAVARNLRA